MNTNRIGRKGLLALAMLGLCALPATAQHGFDGNIIYPAGMNPGGTCDPVCELDGNNNELCLFTACDLIGHCQNNDTTDPLLGDPANTANPNWVPAESSVASGNNDAVVEVVVKPAACSQCECDPPLHDTCFRGAVPPPSMGADWTQGWTCYDFGSTCDVDFNKPLVILEGQILQDRTLTADNNYLLRGRVAVGDSLDGCGGQGYTLTIEPGTAIFGEFATDGYLVIERGSDIIAKGTVDAPIVMTSEFTFDGTADRGDWGGLVMHGCAVANCADCLNGASCASEGAAGPFCGNDDCDSSGCLRYVRVEYAGIEISLNNELNAFTWNALGCGTEINYCQSSWGDDDLFEWFGGRVYCRHLVGIGGADDGLDWQMGFRGGVQFAVIQFWPGFGDNGIEADNNEFDFDADCRSKPTMANLTLVGGDPDDGTVTADHAIHLRRGTDADIFNSILGPGWTDDAFRVQHVETAARGFQPCPGVACGSSASTPDVVADASFGVNAFPNPTANATTFSFDLPREGRTRINVYDTQGRLVERVMDEDLSAGSHNVRWSLPEGSAAGTFFYKVEAGDQTATGRVFGIR